MICLEIKQRYGKIFFRNSDEISVSISKQHSHLPSFIYEIVQCIKWFWARKNLFSWSHLKISPTKAITSTFGNLTIFAKCRYHCFYHFFVVIDRSFFLLPLDFWNDKGIRLPSLSSFLGLIIYKKSPTHSNSIFLEVRILRSFGNSPTKWLGALLETGTFSRKNYEISVLVLKLRSHIPSFICKTVQCIKWLWALLETASFYRKSDIICLNFKIVQSPT